jgi:FkbM family methyltransferase
LRGDVEQEMALLTLLVRVGDHVIDVGGNRGVYAYRLWRLKTRVEVFEPNPNCSSILAQWAADKPNVNIHAIALSSHPGNARLLIPIDERGVEHDSSASLESHPNGNAREQLVSLRSLDSYGFDDASLIKIDTEGHESAIIEGAITTLRSSYPALIVEIEQRHSPKLITQTFNQISVLGYIGFFMYNAKLVSLREFDTTRHQSIENFGGARGSYCNNFLFLHKSRIANGDYRALANRWM